MSAFVFFGGGSANDIAVKLTTNVVTVIAGSASFATAVYWVNFAEIAASTPTITLEKYDGTTSTFIIHTRAMTANGNLVFSEGIWLNPGSFLRATAGTANQVDVTGLYALQNTQSA